MAGMEPERAAVKIQKVERGRQARVLVNKIRIERKRVRAAVKIQSHERGRRTRKDVKARRAALQAERESLVQREQAAIRIQKMERGRSARHRAAEMRAAERALEEGSLGDPEEPMLEGPDS